MDCHITIERLESIEHVHVWTGQFWTSKDMDIGQAETGRSGQGP